MEVKRKCPVVMLTTNQKSKIWLRSGKLEYNSSASDKINPQAIYILSDKEIKEGDWVLINNDHPDGRLRQIIWTSKEPGQFAWNEATNEWDIPCDYLYLQKPKQGAGFLRFTECKKIIATTDESLGLPSPSPQFIESYISSYNEGKPITEVMVSYTEAGFTIKGKGAQAYGESLKVDKHNFITITKIKDSWSREEVEKLFFRANKELRLLAGDRLMDWVDKNL